MKKAIYPGSFDPITNGHVDIVKRALTIFDELLIGISVNQEKSALFSLEERQELISQTFSHEPRIKVVIFSGLLVDFALSSGVKAIVRGLRAVTDFDYEFQLASMNKSLRPECDTIFLMSSNESYFLSSRLVKEVAKLGGDIRPMVPAHVARALAQQTSR